MANGEHKFNFRGETMFLVETKYLFNGNLGLVVYDENGEDYATATLNICPLPENQLIADTKNCPELIEALASQGFIRKAGYSVRSRFRSYPVYTFLK